MAFKVGPKSKKMQELEAALGIESTPAKPKSETYSYSQYQISSNSPPTRVDRIEAAQDVPQSASIYWHREPRTYKVVDASVSSISSRSPPSQPREPREPSPEPVRVVAREATSPSTFSPPPTSRIPASPPPSSPFETPKERALNALKKANEPSRIPAPRGSRNIMAALEDPSNKETKLRIPSSKTSALRAAFEKEVAAVNETLKPPLVIPKKQVFIPPETPEAPREPPTPPPTGITDITKSWVEGEGFVTGWHTKPNKFIVHARDADGQMVIGSKCVVDMKSRIAHAAPVQVVVRKNTDGAHMCAYVPWHEGDYMMTIFLDGRILAQNIVRVRPASERTEAEIEEASRKQEEANKRRAEEQSRQTAASTRVGSFIPSPNYSRNISNIPSPASPNAQENDNQWEREKLEEEARKKIEAQMLREQEELAEKAREQAAREEEERLAAEAEVAQKREELARAEAALSLRDDERLAEAACKEERRMEEQQEQEGLTQMVNELADARAIELEKLALEEVARKVAEEEARQQEEDELRLLEEEEARLLEERRQTETQLEEERRETEMQLEEEQARLLEERRETERQLEEEFEYAKLQADAEEAQEALLSKQRVEEAEEAQRQAHEERLAKQLAREEAEEAQRLLEEEFEEASRLAELEEQEELRQHERQSLDQEAYDAQFELPSIEEPQELVSLEEAQQLEQVPYGEPSQEGPIEGEPLPVTAIAEEPFDERALEEEPAQERAPEGEPAADWELPPSPGHDPLHGFDPEEAVRQAAARGRLQALSKSPVEEAPLRQTEEDNFAQALADAAARAQKEVVQAEIARLKEEDQWQANAAAAATEREAAREREEAKQRAQAELSQSPVNFHAPITRGKEELRKQVPQKRPPPPQKRPPAPPTARVTSPIPPPPTEHGPTIVCSCGEPNPSNMKFCCGCGKRLAGAATSSSVHSFVEAQRAAAERARFEADPEAAEREARAAVAERMRQEEQERLRREQEASDARKWEETQRALDDAEGAPPVPPFEEPPNVFVHLPPGGGGAVDPSQSWMDGDGVLMGWHQRSNKFTVYARDSDGNPVLDSKCVVEMKPISSRVPPITVVVHKNAEGTHTCAYLPFNEGEFLLSVYLDGQAIRDSPRKVLVKRR